MMEKRRKLQRNWAELLCCSSIQLFWARVVMRKWLNIGSNESDYSADPEDDDEFDEDDDDYDDEHEG